MKKPYLVLLLGAGLLTSASWSWAQEVAPAAAELGGAVSAIVGYNSYECRGRNRVNGARISEHGKGNAIDIRGIRLDNGTVVDWTTEAIRPGDLVFLETAVGSGVIGHVGIATGPNTWIQAPRTGDVIREGSFTTTRVVGVRRLVAD